MSVRPPNFNFPKLAVCVLSLVNAISVMWFNSIYLVVATFNPSQNFSEVEIFRNEKKKKMAEQPKDWEVFLNPVKKGKEWEVNIAEVMDKFMTGLYGK